MSLHRLYLEALKALETPSQTKGVGVVALKMDDPVGTSVKTGINYTQHLKSKPVKGHVSTTQQGNNLPSESQILHPGVITDGHQITVEGSRTLNLGNFESVRIGVILTVPTTMDALNEAYEFATDWVSEKLEQAVQAAKGEG